MHRLAIHAEVCSLQLSCHAVPQKIHRCARAEQGQSAPDCKQRSKSTLLKKGIVLLLRYTEVLELGPDRAELPRLHANRSLAYLRAGRHADALADAGAALAAAPNWAKAHWRRGAALRALGCPLEALAAFHKAWQLSPGTASSTVAYCHGCVGSACGSTQQARCCGF